MYKLQTAKPSQYNFNYFKYFICLRDRALRPFFCICEPNMCSVCTGTCMYKCFLCMCLYKVVVLVVVAFAVRCFCLWECFLFLKRYLHSAISSPSPVLPFISPHVAVFFWSHAEQGSSVHHRKCGGEWPRPDARLPQSCACWPRLPPTPRPCSGLLWTALKTKKHLPCLNNTQTY